MIKINVNVHVVLYKSKWWDIKLFYLFNSVCLDRINLSAVAAFGSGSLPTFSVNPQYLTSFPVTKSLFLLYN